jgi:hypothetical protein
MQCRIESGYDWFLCNSEGMVIECDTLGEFLSVTLNNVVLCAVLQVVFRAVGVSCFCSFRG